MPRKQFEILSNVVIFSSLLVVCFIFIYSSYASVQPVNDDSVVIQVIRVYDGDTLYANIDGWPPIIGKKIGIRINGIDAAEMSSLNKEDRDLAKKAKYRLNELITNAKEVRIHKLKRDKYFRILALVTADGRDVGQILLNEKLVKEYHGGKKN